MAADIAIYNITNEDGSDGLSSMYILYERKLCILQKAWKFITIIIMREIIFDSKNILICGRSSHC